MRRLALHACKAFEKEVKDHLREGLAPDEFSDTAASQERHKLKEAAGAGGINAPGKERAKLTSRVKQAKIVRLSDRVDSLTGKGKSKGYGFLEMRDHADALRVLRWANNNPDVQPLLREWYKEEIKDLINTLEKDTKGGDTTKAQLHRAKETLKEFEGQDDKAVKSKKTIVLEFSIENILIVKKRTSRGEEHRSAGPSAKVREHLIFRRYETDIVHSCRTSDQMCFKQRRLQGPVRLSERTMTNSSRLMVLNLMPHRRREDERRTRNH